MTESQIQYALQEATMNQISKEVSRRINNIEKSLTTAKEIQEQLRLVSAQYEKRDVEKMLKDLKIADKVFEKCKKAVCNSLGISFEKIQSNTREKDVVEARHILVYLVRANSTITSKEMGALINRDHATVLNSEKVISAAFVGNKQLLVKLRICEESLDEINQIEESLKNINEEKNL